MNNENCLQLIDISYGIIQQQTNKNRFTKLIFKYMIKILSTEKWMQILFLANH